MPNLYIHDAQLVYMKPILSAGKNKIWQTDHLQFPHLVPVMSHKSNSVQHCVLCNLLHQPSGEEYWIYAWIQHIFRVLKIEYT